LPAWEDPTGVALPGANGLVITNNSGTPTTQLDIDADTAILLNSTNNPAIVTSINLTINAATTGANGLDTGSLGNNTWYYAYIIYNGTTTAGLLSTSATSPTLPSGYTFSYRVGAIRTGGSATFTRVWQVGNRAQYVVVSGSTTPNMPLMASGSSGNISTPTWTALAVGSYVPPSARVIGLVMTERGSGGIVVAPNNAYGAEDSLTNPPHFKAFQFGSVIGLMTLESTNIYWASSSAASRLWCSGWIDAVNAN
jgi:hypothetical protein